MPRIETKYRLIGLVALVLLTTRIGLGSFFSSASDITVSNVSSAINKERTSRNIPALTYNNLLAAAAAYKANDMVTRKYFSHTDPEGNYIWPKIVAEGYTPYITLGENLAIDFSDTEGLVTAWMDSPTHRQNILNSDFKDQGMGVTHGNPSAGEYSVAVANTFGEQPSEVNGSTPHVKPTPTPRPTSSTQISPTIKPTAVKTPTPKPTPIPTAISPTPLPTPVHPPIPSPTGKSQDFTAPQIAVSTIKLSATANSQEIKLTVSAQIAGIVDSANATVLGNTTQLSKDSSADTYSGTITLPKYFDFKKTTMILAAQNSGGTNQINIPLDNVSLPDSQNPKVLGNLAAKLKSPDLYNVFKYIVIVFGGLFILFLIADYVYRLKNKAAKAAAGSNLVILFIFISTLLLVHWWH